MARVLASPVIRSRCILRSSPHHHGSSRGEGGSRESRSLSAGASHLFWKLFVARKADPDLLALVRWASDHLFWSGRTHSPDTRRGTHLDSLHHRVLHHSGKRMVRHGESIRISSAVVLFADSSSFARPPYSVQSSSTCPSILPPTHACLFPQSLPLQLSSTPARLCARPTRLHHSEAQRTRPLCPLALVRSDSAQRCSISLVNGRPTTRNDPSPFETALNRSSTAVLEAPLAATHVAYGRRRAGSPA